MLALNATMPATARHGEPASEIELLGGGLDPETRRDLQIRQLMRRCAIGIPMARALSSFVYGEVA